MRYRSLACALLLIGLAVPVYAQVTLSATTTPAAATVGTTVTVSGTNFPAGAMAPTSVTVTITPPPGNGAPVATQSTGVVALGGTRTVQFKVPAGLVVTNPTVCSVAVSGTTGANNAYTTATPSSITINPPASISNVSPGAGTVGTASLPVTIAGSYTTFQNSSTITISGTGVTAVNNGAASTHLINATFTVAPGALPGARDVTVKTGTETAIIHSGFIVATSPGLSFANITPNSAALGQTNLNVTVTGINTHFVAGTTFVNFGDGMTVNLPLTNVTPTSFTANITVSPTTYLGWRIVTAVTGGEYAVSSAQGFDVAPSSASLVSVTPHSASQGTNVTNLVVTGSGTHFLQNATTLSMGAGINVGNIQVNPNGLSLTANIAVGPNATLGAHDVTVTTGGETETLPAAFTVTSSTAFLSNVTPTSGAQGTSVTVHVTGVNTNFLAGTITADFGSNITTTLTPIDATHLDINATIAILANTGGRNVILHDNGTDFTFSFTVTPSGASITKVDPATGPQGGSLSVTVTGNGTHWVQGTTTASILCCSPIVALTINRITVNTATSAVLDITIPANAPVANYTLTMTTGGESVQAGFSVFGATPNMSISPGNGQVGTTVNVHLLGAFTSWVQGATTLNISGTGVTISNFNIPPNQKTFATATFTIDPNAPPGGRTVTMTTGNEIVTTIFGVSTTPAVLISITPNHSPRSNTLNVTVLGQYTHFTQGVTTLSLAPNVITNSVTVSSATLLTANITVDNAAAYGWRQAYVNTGSEQLQIPFNIDAPGPVPVLGGVDNLGNPAHGFQGETVTGVLISGTNTHWVQGVTQLILGAGVTINSLQILGPTSMTCNVVISPTAPIGGNVFVAITGSEIASGNGVMVERGPAQILSVSQSIVTQNQTLTETIAGNNATHWQQGFTNADFGSGVIIDSFTVTDAQHATAQITILSTATTGFHDVTLTTGGEIAVLSQGIDVEQGTPTLLSSTPNSGLQGATLNVQVLGQFTHFVQGTTQAAYSSGIIVNSVTVADSVTATLNITVDPLAFIDIAPPCRSLTVTTGTEQVSLTRQFCVGAGPAELTNLSPNSTPQGSTITVHVTGLNTHFIDGQTSASFGSGVNVSEVSVSSPTTADVQIAATVNAPTGFHTVTLTTLGESASISNAFTVSPGVPTLNGVAPVSAEQGTTLTLHVISQFTHWVQGTTTATFGQGIAINSLTIVDNQTANVNVTIDPLAYLGARTVTFTTGTEIVSSGNLFSVIPGPAIISSVTPGSANRGQEVILNIAGQNTHWLQGLTQFSMTNYAGDIRINAFIVNGPGSATADITIAPNAGLGTRSIYISTAGEVLTDSASFVVTGTIAPYITTLVPNFGSQGDVALNVTINGFNTQWQQGVTIPDFGPGVTVTNVVVNSQTALTAAINIDLNATPGYNTVTVRTGTQALTSSFLIRCTAAGCGPFGPPSPYISYMNPTVGLPGQTFNVTIAGQFTHWDTTTQADFGAGISVNSFQTVTPTSAFANITINAGASQGVRTVTLTTGTNGEIDTAGFNVIFATPYISVVDPSSALQGEPGKTITVIGQYTTWDNTTTFNFGPGVHVSNLSNLGPTVETMTISVDQLATIGGRAVTATTRTHIDSGAGFSVTPSLAQISSVTPNTAMQNDTPTVSVVGQFTHWDATTTFHFAGFGISVTGKTFVDASHYTLTLSLDPLATLGFQSLTATTGGEVATLNNAFVVQPGTPLILSSGPPVIQQQNSLNVTIVGQFTQWMQGSSTVSFGANSGLVVNSVTVTGSEGITANVTALPTTPIGPRTLYVTTGTQTLTLPNAISVTNGPASISSLSPNQGPQGATNYTVNIVGTNTNFAQGVSVATFGSGIGVNSLTVTDATHATASVNIASNATSGFNTVTVTTLGETAIGANAFQILAATPVLLSVSPVSGVQGDTGDSIAVVGAFTHFQQGATTAGFGAGTTASVSVTDATHATVTLNISPTAVAGTRTVTLTTDLGGGNSEIAVWNNQNFTINPSSAAISLLNPANGNQNQVGLPVVITGAGTHFDSTSTVSFGQGITPTGYSNISATSITATVNIDPAATVGLRTVTVTTGGENARITNGFTVNPGVPVTSTASPASAHQNDTLSVQLTTLYTTLQQGVTTASFGAGITVNSLTVTDSTHATANITVSPGAALGGRTVTLTTGAQVADGVGVFTVLAGLPQISALTPSAGNQGSTVTVIVTGLFTNFQQGVSQISMSGGGVTFGTVTVNGPTTLSVPVTIASGAALGTRTVTVTTGTEVASSATALFTIQQGTNLVTQISPNTGTAGNTFNVTLIGQNTNWVNGTTVMSIAPDIQVGGATAGTAGPVTVGSPNALTASVTIPNGTLPGPRNVTVQTGGQVQTVTSGFTVLPANDTTRPTVINTSPAGNATSVPLNSTISITFSKPIDPTTLITNPTNVAGNSALDVDLYDSTTNQYIGGTITLDASGRIGTFVPAQLLAVNRQYRFELYGGGSPSIKDTVTPTPNALVSYNFNFTTGFSTSTTGPALISSNVHNGDTGIALNTPVVLQFSTPIDPVTQPNGILVQTGSPGINVPGTYSFSSGNTIVTFTPTGSLSSNTVYTVIYSAQVTDSAGNPLTNPGSLSFTTGTTADTGPGPTIISYNPVSGETGVSTGVTVTFRFSKPVNPVSINAGNFLVENDNTGIVVSSTISFTPDRLAATLTPNAPLTPLTEYAFRIFSYTDLAGNAGQNTGFRFFTTGAGLDTTAPTVSVVSPTPNITGVPVNANIVAVMSKPIDATSVNNNSITLSPPAAGTVTLASDQVTLTFTPSAPLAVSTVYTIQISGFNGVNDVAVTPFSSSFTTGASATPDTTRPVVTSFNPPSSSTQPENTTITLVLSEPMNPASWVAGTGNDSLRVASNVNGVVTLVGGTIAVTNTAANSTVVFTPSSPLNAGATISVQTPFNFTPTDFAGNLLSGSTGWSFTITGPADTAPPTVTSITPSNGTTGVGQNTPIVITFSEPINPNTITGTTFGLFNGSTQIGTSITRSADNRTVTLTQTLPSSALVNVAITHSVTDLAGNALADFTSQFTTAATPPTTSPNVVTQRPGSGATGVDPPSPITLITDKPLNPSTVQNALHIAQNGVLVAGTLQFNANNQSVVFTPGAPLTSGALVQVFFDNTATDAFGNPLNAYSGQFTVAATGAGVGPTVTSLSPTYATTIAITNPVVDIQFTKPIDPATVTTSNIFLKGNDTTVIPATISMFSPTVVRIVPNSALPVGPYYRINILAAVKDTQGNAYTGPTATYYFYVGSTATPDNVNPIVTGIAPPNGSTTVGDNALFRIQFSKSIDPLSVNANTIRISGGGYTAMASSISFDGPNQNITITPQSPLPDNTPMAITINGVTDPSGNAVVPFTANFTTIGGPSTTRPSVISSSVDSGATNVPVNSVFTVNFSTPMDTRFLNGTNFYLYDNTFGAYIPTAVSFSPDGSSGTLAPVSPLPVGRSIQLGARNAQDVTGNTMTNFAINFTTSFSTNTNPPTVLFTSIGNGATGVPTNPVIQIQFSESLQSTSLSQITLTGSALSTTAALSSGDQVVTLTPNTLLLPNTTYTLTIAGAKDTSGNTMVGTVTSTFTTGPGVNITGRTAILSFSPGATESNVGTNVAIVVKTSSPINPISVSSGNFFVLNTNNAAHVPGTISFSADRTVATLTPNAPLSPFNTYRYNFNYSDITGNTSGTGNIFFTTGAGSDTTSPSVTVVSPTNGITGVPVNTQIGVIMSDGIDATSITNSSITVTPTSPAGPTVSGTVSLASDLVSLSFTPQSVLSVSTTYSIQVSGFRGVDGVAVTPFSSTFTTGASATPDTTRPALTTFSPANGSTQPSNTTITANFSEPMNPASFAADTGNDSMYVQVCTNVCAFIPGTIAVTDTPATATVVFTPATPLTPGATVNVHFCYNFCPTDFAGNTLIGNGWSFSLAAGVDNTPPTITSITPSNGTVGAGQNTPIVITFSKPLNPNSINATTFGIFNGDSQLGTSITRSADNRTVTLTQTLPSSSLINVVVTHGVTDLVGNALADFASQFTTAANPPTGHPNVITMRPSSGATGVDPATPVTIVTDTPLSQSTVPGALHVSQNGVLVNGSISYSANTQTILFTPSTPFTANAQVQVFFDTTATDAYGNTLNSFTGSFTVAASTNGVGPSVTALSPVYGSTISITNPIVDIQFTKPIDPTTVNTTNIFLKQNDSTVIPASVSLFAPNVVRIVPNSALSPSGQPYYRINITAAVKDTQGLAYTGPNATYYFYVNLAATPDNVSPIVTGLAPPDGSSTVGDNALFRVTFSKPVDPLSVNQTTLNVSGGSYTAIPLSISFDGPNQTVTVTPQVPLPDNSALTMTLAGISDPSGNAITPVTAHFTTEDGPDTVAPYVVSASVTAGQTNVPVNSVFTVQFSEPMDTRLLAGTNFYLHDNYIGSYLPVNISFSGNGMTGTIVPTSPLPVGRSISLGARNAEDVTGNTLTAFPATFTTAFTTNAAPPTVTYTNPYNGQTAVPTNTQIQIEFSEPVQATSLSQVTLTGSSLTTTASLSNGNTILTLTPNTLLIANTTYTLTIQAVRDISGNVMSSPVVVTFTTGSGADLSGRIQVSSFTPGSSQTNVATNSVITVRFNKPIDTVSVLQGDFFLENNNNNAIVPATVSFSADRLTVTLTPNGALSPLTRYFWELTGYTDMVGNGGPTADAFFYTGTGSDSTSPTVTSVSPTDAVTGVAVNAAVQAVMSSPIDPTSVTNGAITLTPTSPAGPAITGTVSIASDQVTLTFAPATPLAVSTTYTIQISGFRGVNGAAVTPFSSTFTTGASSTPDHTSPAVTSFNPANGTTQPSNTTLTAIINKPMNPVSFVVNTGFDSLYVQSCTNVCAFIPGTLTVTNTAVNATVTFTPSNPLPVGASVTFRLCYNFCPSDFAGNTLSPAATTTFTVSGSPDSTPPAVTSVTPVNGATGVGRFAPVVITFSKPLNPNTINGNTFTLLNGDTYLNTGVTRSNDNRVVTLTATMPASSLITVAITGAVTDLSGNALAPFTSQFTTAAAPPVNSFSITSQRPSNGSGGIPVNSPIYLITNRAVNPNSISGALHVSQNGTLFPGTTSVSSNGEAILFTPASNFAYNATIQVFLDTTATDTSGNPVNAYSGAFTTTAAPPDTSTISPTVTTLSPTYGSTISVTNPVVDIQFTKNIAVSSVNTTNFYLLRNDTGSPVAATVTQPFPNMVRISPSAPLDPTGQPYYRIHILAAVQDTDGNTYTGPTATYYFYVQSTAVADTNVPTVVGVAPSSGSTVGDNALINVTFSKAMEVNTISAATISVNGGVVPASFSFGGSNTTVVVTPLAPLPDNTALTLTLSGGSNGIIDPQGNALTTQTVNFTVGGGPDTSSPYVVSSTIDNGITVPSNSTYAVTFNKPMYTPTLNSSGFYLHDSTNNTNPAVSRSFSADGTTAFINPTSPLTGGHSITLNVFFGSDLNGNAQVNTSYTFTASATPDNNPPSVAVTNPGPGQSSVPINTQLQILFNKSVQAASVSQITLTGGPAVTLTPSLTNGDQTVILLPNAPLAANTTYTLTIQGVTSTAGIAMSSPVTVTFTTGPGVQLVGPPTAAIVPANGATNVPVTVTPTVTFSEPINALSAYGYIILRLNSNNSTVPSTLSFSADYKTVTITPNSPLTSGTQYNVLFQGGGNVTDQAGNGALAGTAANVFTTQ